MPAFPKPTATETDPVAGPNLTTHAALTTSAHGGIVASSDARLTDARTPTAHKSTHATGESDALAPGDIGAATAAAAVAAQSTADGAVVLAGTMVPKSLVDAKGDLFVGSADDTVIRKAVGSNGQVLTADSSAAGGVKWATMDLTSLVTLSPSTAARNTIQPSADVVPLTVKGKSSQTANLTEWQSSAGTVLAYVSAGGVPYAPYGLVTGNLVTSAVADATQFGPQITLSSTAAKVTNRNTASNVVLTVKGMAAQTGNLQEWQNSSAAVLSTVSENGYFTTRKVAAPADAELANSEAAYWLDDTPGATKFMVKAKDSAGTVRTGSLALT